MFTEILAGKLGERLRTFQREMDYGKTRDRTLIQGWNEYVTTEDSSYYERIDLGCDGSEPDSCNEGDTVVKTVGRIINEPNRIVDYPESFYKDSPCKVSKGFIDFSFSGEKNTCSIFGPFVSQFGCKSWRYCTTSLTKKRAYGKTGMLAALIYEKNPKPSGQSIAYTYSMVCRKLASSMGNLEGLLETLIETRQTVGIVANHVAALVPLRSRIIQRLAGKASVHPLDYYFMYEPTATMANDFLHTSMVFNAMAEKKVWLKANDFAVNSGTRREYAYVRIRSLHGWQYLRCIMDLNYERRFQLTAKTLFQYPGPDSEDDLVKRISTQSFNLKQMWNAVPNSWWIDGFLNISMMLTAFNVNERAIGVNPGRTNGIVLNEVDYSTVIDVATSEEELTGYDSVNVTAEPHGHIINREVHQDIGTGYFLGKIMMYKDYMTCPSWMSTLLKGSTYMNRLEASGIKDVNFKK